MSSERERERRYLDDELEVDILGFGCGPLSPLALATSFQIDTLLIQLFEEENVNRKTNRCRKKTLV